MGTVKGSLGFFLFETPESGEVVERVLVVRNDRTGAVYLCIYGSPESEWDTVKYIGETIMTHLVIDENF